MKCPKIFAALLACVGLIAIPATLAQASINSMSLSATYDAQQANITFRVYSSQAMRIIKITPYASDEESDLFRPLEDQATPAMSPTVPGPVR
jgi:hypothetical protein